LIWSVRRSVVVSTCCSVMCVLPWSEEVCYWLQWSHTDGYSRRRR
jgi:hypothetical protein